MHRAAAVRCSLLWLERSLPSAYVTSLFLPVCIDLEIGDVILDLAFFFVALAGMPFSLLCFGRNAVLSSALWPERWLLSAYVTLSCPPALE